uniref:Immunoglobulin V-set domain-containing protein n=1 Tax=Maylandia zebra TaxID=106582 RepID=A0A3P9BK11_9CICH
MVYNSICREVYFSFFIKKQRQKGKKKKQGRVRCDKSSVLYQVHEGVEVSESQDAKFSGRVQSDKDALREGRIRLQLLRTDDSGLYLCEVNTDYGFGSASSRLNVTGMLI